MIIYLSMILVLFLVYCVQNVKKRGEYKSETSRVEMMLVFGYIIFWTGIRDGFVDTYAYISKFNNANLEDLQYLEFTIDSGFGFDILEIVFKTFISDNYHMWLMFLAIITGGCIAVTFRRYSVNFYYTVFLFLASTNFTWLMNGIRQFLAVAIIFACTPLIEKKRWCAYCMIVLLCSTIHASCLLMIPVYFLVQMETWSKKNIIILIFSLVLLIVLIKYTNVSEIILADTGWATISETYADDDGVNPLRVLVYSIPAIFAVISQKYLRDEKEIVGILINLSFITSGLYVVAMFTSGIMIGRLPMYIQMHGYILLPYIIENNYSYKSRVIIYYVSIIFYLLYFYLMTRGIYYSSELTGFIY